MNIVSNTSEDTAETLTETTANIAQTLTTLYVTEFVSTTGPSVPRVHLAQEEVAAEGHPKNIMRMEAVEGLTIATKLLEVLREWANPRDVASTARKIAARITVIHLATLTIEPGVSSRVLETIGRSMATLAAMIEEELSTMIALVAGRNIKAGVATMNRTTSRTSTVEAITEGTAIAAITNLLDTEAIRWTAFRASALERSPVVRSKRIPTAARRVEARIAVGNHRHKAVLKVATAALR